MLACIHVTLLPSLLSYIYVNMNLTLPYHAPHRREMKKLGQLLAWQQWLHQRVTRSVKRATSCARFTPTTDCHAIPCARYTQTIKILLWGITLYKMEYYMSFLINFVIILLNSFVPIYWLLHNITLIHSKGEDLSTDKHM